MEHLNQLGYELNFNKQNNWFECNKNNVNITLTLTQ
jgi:hypothetical protein